MKKRRLISLLLTVILILCLSLSLTGCNRSYDEEEVIAAAKQLLKKAEPLNTIFHGEGIGYIDSGYRDGVYYEADPIHLGLLGIRDPKKLFDITYEVFSIKHGTSIISVNFEPLYDSKGNIVYNSRYAFVTTKDGEVKLLVNKNYDPSRVNFDDEMTYKLDTVKALGSEGDYVNMSVDVVVLSEDGKEQTLTIEFKLFEESDGWRIHGTCIANYNEYLDHPLFNN